MAGREDLAPKGSDVLTRDISLSEFNDKFNIETGHDHDGTDSAKISWNNILDKPTFNNMFYSLTMPTNEYTTTDDGNGTLGVTWNSQSAGLVLASPSGASGTPSFRSLIIGDITDLQSSLNAKAPLSNPTFTGTVTATTFAGNASTATKLATARTLSLTGDVTGSGSFDGSGNLSITATVADNSHYHGKSTITSVYADKIDDVEYLTVNTPLVDRPMFDVLRGDRTAFLPADQIIIEQSIDGGVTWTDAGVSDIDKRKLFTGQRPSIYIPLKNGIRSTDCMLRVTITGMKYNVPEGTIETEKYNYWNSNYVLSTERYTTIESGWVWLSSVVDNIQMTLEKATGLYPNNWVTERIAYMSGWTGGNYFSTTSSTFGGGTDQTTNYWNRRFTFRTCSSINTLVDADLSTSYTTSKQRIYAIKTTGLNAWTYSNGYMYNEHLYNWDENQNATFPANLTATSFIGPVTGNASTATKWSSPVTLSLTGDVTASGSIDGSGNVELNTTALNLSPFIAGTQTATTNAFTGNAPTISALYDGLTIRYWLPYAGNGSNDTLNLTLSDESTTGDLAIYWRSATRLSTHYPAGSVIILTYRENVSISGSGSYTGWWCDADYDSDTYDRMWFNSDIIAGVDLYPYKLLMQAPNGKFYPLTLEYGTGTTKTVSTQEFTINSPILLYNSSITVLENNVTVETYSERTLFTVLPYTANQTTWTSQLPIYLKGTILANGNFKLDNTSYTSFMTQTLPTTEDGFVYILLGHMSTTIAMRLMQYHPIYEFKDGYLREYVPSHKHNLFTNIHALNSSGTDVTNSPYTASTSTSSLNIKAGTGITLSMDSSGIITIGGVNQYTHPTYTVRAISLDTSSVDVLDTLTITSDETGHITSATGAKRTLPTATSSVTGVLSSTDWSTFNNKINSTSGTTTGYVPIWGADGKTLGTGYLIETTLTGSSSALVRADAIKTYIDNIIPTADALIYKGVIDCSTNPNFPVGDKGFVYKISVSGKIGGASGATVEAGDMIICNTDSTATGDYATVGSYWDIIQNNIDTSSLQPIDDDLTALSALATTGFAVRTATGSWSTRSLTNGTGISITNGDGVAGNVTITHSDTSSQTSISNSGRSYIQSVTLDSMGHVTALTSATETNDPNYYPTTFAWSNGTTAGPTGSLTGSGMSAVSFGAIPSASDTVSGIVTTGSQIIAGAKTFTDNVTIYGHESERSLIFDGNSTDAGNWRILHSASGSGDTNYLTIQSTGSSTSTYYDVLRFGMDTKDAKFSGNIYPETTNTKTLGTASLLWSNVYATTFTGNVTGNVSGSSGSCTGNSSTATLASTATTTEDTSNELLLVGVTSGATTTLKRDTNVTVTSGTIKASTYKFGTSAYMQYNSTTECIDFIFN